MSYLIQFKRFLRDTSGNFAVFTALTALPLALAAGIAVDYTELSRTKTQIQNALDASVLASGVDENLTPEERIELALDHFDALSANWNFTAVPTITVDDTVVSATLAVDKPTYFGGLLGHSTVGISVATEIKYSIKSAAEVALVLDYSSSMSHSGKWQAMRDAAKDLIDVLGEDGERDDISFALAPFSRIVYGDFPSEYIVGEASGSTWSGCTQDRKFPFNNTDSTPDTNDDDSKWGLTPSANSNQCATHISRGLKIRELNNDHGQVKTWLDSMTTGYGTHISLGMEMGWHLVSPNDPFTGGVAYDTEGVKKFIVLLTDGHQTVKAWGPSDTYKKSNGEDNLEAMCTAAKNKDIGVITIAFNLNDGATKNRLKDCATNWGYFFDADNNSQLAYAFETVAALIQGSLHVSK